MTPVRVAPICALVALLLAAACSKDEATPGGADAAAPGPDGASPSLDGPATCGSIRNCTLACGADAACVKRCVDTAPAAARTRYEAVVMCTKRGCPDGDEVCTCTIQCDAPSDCIDLVDECVGLDEDQYCTVNCR
jgi:hypothetical protein